MLITNSVPNLNIARPKAQQTPVASSNVPSESFTPSEASAQPKERYEAWVPLANAGVVAGVVGVPSLLGAAGHAVFGASPFIPIGVAAVATAGAATWSYKSSMKAFNKHPILVGLSVLTAGTAAALAAPFASIPGAAYGWKGAAVAMAVAGVGAGVISAVGIHQANKKIDAHNATLARA